MARRSRRAPLARWLTAALLAAACVGGPATAGDGWLEGAAGYAEAFRRSAERGVPVLVYFYADWCPYCRELDEQLLGRPEVRAALAGLLAVRINPERGEAEAALAARYSLPGYPGLFLHPAGDPAAWAPVRRTTLDGGALRLKTPQEFVRGLDAP